MTEGTARRRYGILLVAAGVVAISVLIVLLIFPPGCQESRESNARSSCYKQVWQIGHAMIAYANEHDGSFPPTLGVLLKDGYLTSVDVFICPSTGNRVPRTFPRDFRNADLQVLNQVEEFGSYVYVKGLRHEDRSDVVVLFDKPGNHRDSISEGRVCLFVDGSDRFESEELFQKQMKDQKAGLNH